jgi:hypothetical protein
VTAFAIPDLFGLPRADEISDAATHAPSASFQILLYDLFIFENLSQVTRDTNRMFWYSADKIIRTQRPNPDAHKIGMSGFYELRYWMIDKQCKFKRRHLLKIVNSMRGS